jgi:diguanylate cyclase (GGDEF)-like protein
LIAATTNVAAVLADWWRTAFYLIGIAALAIFVVAAGTFLVIRQFKNYASLERARAEKVEAETLREQTLRLDAALSNMSQGLVMFDSAARLVVCNDRYREICKLTPNVAKPGCTFLDILKYRAANGSFFGNPEEYVGDLLTAIAKGKTEGREIKTADGRIISVVNQPMTGGGWVATHEDITERKQAEAQIFYIARHDLLTVIANRAVLHEKMEEALARLRRRQELFSVFVLDLDGFKHINDTLGHAAGDKLLKELAQRLQSVLRETDFLARLGGDEFAIVQSGESNPREEAIALAGRVLEIVAQPFNLDGHDVTVGTSIGIAFAPEDGADAGELLQKADLALYRVKSEGRNNFCFFDAEMSKGAGERLQLLTDMRTALTRKEFELYYQPIFDAKTRWPCGVEALVRWRHPVQGLLSPDHFIPLAEETGLMEPLGEWILEQACIDAASWPEHIKVAVNLSAVQFRTDKLFDVILCALVESGLRPERLELEITESVLMQDAERYGTVIQQLKNIGISIVLDDFGTGYSSLSYLTTFPFDKIKIDKSFTQGLSNRADCSAIVASVLTLARGLDMIVTAEGVETTQQFELLRAAGAHQVQGYLFARPSPVAELNFAALEQKGQAIEAA